MANFCNNPAIRQFHYEAIRNDLPDYLMLIPRKIPMCWYTTDSRQGQTQLVIMNLPLIALGLAGLWTLVRHSRQTSFQLFALMVLLAYFWAIDVFVGSRLRYLVPVFWIVFLLDALFVDRLILGRRGKTPARATLPQEVKGPSDLITTADSPSLPRE